MEWKRRNIRVEGKTTAVSYCHNISNSWAVSFIPSWPPKTNFVVSLLSPSLVEYPGYSVFHRIGECPSASNSSYFSLSNSMHFLGAIRGSAAETSIFFLRILGSPSHARLETLPPRHPAASKTFPRARIANRGFESDARMSTFNRVIDVDIAWGPKLGNIVWVCLNNFLISNPNRSFWACFAASQRMTTVGTMQPTYHDGRPRSSILQILPVELLSEIKSHIPLHDLFTLVCFYKTCTKFAQLFGSVQTQAKFWESACLLAGLGCLPGERAEEVDWKHVAFDCIERDGSCKHPECGRARLEWNGVSIFVYITE